MKRTDYTLDLDNDVLEAMERLARADQRGLQEYMRIVLRRHVFGRSEGLPPIAAPSPHRKYIVSRQVIPRRIRNQVIAESLGYCRYCGDPITPGKCVVDHIQPVALGGDTVHENLVAACPKCNLAKGDKTLLEFVADRAT